MKHKKLKFCLCLVFITTLFVIFIAYYCRAKPDKLFSDNSIQNKNSLSKETQLSKQTERSNNLEKTKKLDVVKESLEHHISNLSKDNAFSSSGIKQPESKISKTDSNPLEFYICEITDFYELIITLLLGVVGIVLVVSFLSIYFASKKQAEDLASEALESKSFIILLNDMVSKNVAEIKNEDEIAELITLKDEIIKRLEFLEKEITKKSYEIKKTTAEIKKEEEIKEE